MESKIVSDKRRFKYLNRFRGQSESRRGVICFNKQKLSLARNETLADDELQLSGKCR